MISTEQHTPAANAARDESFQARVHPWMMACFGAEIAADGAERNHRFLEEALELVQSTGCTASEAHQLVDYVYGRPAGEPAQEVGGVMVTLAALCLAQGLDMHAAGETELARIWTLVEAIRAKQAAKPKHSPLPAAAPQTAADERQAFERLAKLHAWDLAQSNSDGVTRWLNPMTRDLYLAFLEGRAALAAAPVPAASVHCNDGPILSGKAAVERLFGRNRNTASEQPDAGRDAALDQAMRERDYNEAFADQLSNCIADYFGVDIGEHSSANCPWTEAVRVIEEAPPVATHPALEVASAPDESNASKNSSSSNSLEFDGIKAAPEQAQEPVLVRVFEESGSDRESGAWFDIAASEAKGYTEEGYKARKLFATPVQPVAVPDGNALVNAMCKAGLANDHGRRTLLNGEEIGFDLITLIAIVRLAAPAAQGCVHAWQLRAERAEADLVEAQRQLMMYSLCMNTAGVDALHSRVSAAEARVKELEAQLARRRAPLSPETQQAIAAARAAGRSIAATPGGLVFMNNGAEPGCIELDCPACGGSGHIADTPGGSAP